MLLAKVTDNVYSFIVWCINNHHPTFQHLLGVNKHLWACPEWNDADSWSKSQSVVYNHRAYCSKDLREHNDTKSHVFLTISFYFSTFTSMKHHVVKLCSKHQWLRGSKWILLILAYSYSPVFSFQEF